MPFKVLKIKKDSQIGTIGGNGNIYELDRYINILLPPPGGPGGLAVHTIPAGKFVKWILCKSLGAQNCAVESAPGLENIVERTAFNANEIVPFPVNKYFPIESEIDLSADAVAGMRILIIYIDVNLT